MSTWPQAVWIVNSLQKNFDFTGDLKTYVKDLQNVNSQVNTLTATVYQNLLQKKMSFFAVDSEGSPQGVEEFGKDSIWFIEE